MRCKIACSFWPSAFCIGSDSQRPFAIVIVGGLMANLLMSIFLLPTLYVWVARKDDVLPAVDTAEEF